VGIKSTGAQMNVRCDKERKKEIGQKKLTS
jgi:hypothetical protein